MKMKIMFGVFMLLVVFTTLGFCANTESGAKTPKTLSSYSFPTEESKHEGTWLQWPHNYTYGEGHKEKLQDIWIEMTLALSKGENVHIVAYNEDEKYEIEELLKEVKVNMKAVDFKIYPTDDVWVRDNGPVFVNNPNNQQVMLDWGFNGWGNKTPYKKCLEIPKKISADLGYTRIDLQKVILEGGAVEFDGKGTCLTTRSSVSNKNRNPKMTEAQIEGYIKKYYGVSKVIWLNGVSGQDITDFHIDGFARFFNNTTLITMKADDLAEWGLSDSDIDKLLAAKNTDGKTYKPIYLPLTKQNVVLDNGTDLGYKGSYVNFYIANGLVLVPNYKDANDLVANKAIQKLYPNRKVVGIDVRELYKDGGMIHCVTQQQPAKIKP